MLFAAALLALRMHFLAGGLRLLMQGTDVMIDKISQVCSHCPHVCSIMHGCYLPAAASRVPSLQEPAWATSTS